MNLEILTDLARRIDLPGEIDLLEGIRHENVLLKGVRYKRKLAVAGLSYDYRIFTSKLKPPFYLWPDFKSARGKYRGVCPVNASERGSFRSRPTFWVVGGAQDDPARGPLPEHGHFDGGRGGLSEIHHLAPHPAERPDHDLGVGVSGRPGIASHDDAWGAPVGHSALATPRAKGPGVSHKNGRVQAPPHDATNAGDGGDEGVVRSHGRRETRNKKRVGRTMPRRGDGMPDKA